MSNQIILVTDPDDIQQDGLRLLFVNLDDKQTQLVSACLNNIEVLPTLVIYVWNSGDDIDWLLDKKHKSSIIVFNADSQDDLITGYLAGQLNSYYLGTLRLLETANVNKIIDQHQLTDILVNTLQ